MRCAGQAPRRRRPVNSALGSKNFPPQTSTTMRLSATLLLTSAALFGGCATVTIPVPPNYEGPIAQLADTVSLDKNGRDQIFAAIEFEGESIKNALGESRRASAGRGFAGIVLPTSRPVPARKSRYKILGTHFSSAPIAELARRAAGTFQSVDGEIEFAPENGKTYEVVGELSKELSCVWISDASTKTPASPKVCSK
jgi:hypothetical protein